ncbi:MAG: prephenate dehydratase [Victivallales bacterium]|nr:prephenate dehydratase [Victivallales bacterium]
MDIEKLRTEIDAIDTEIIQLLNKRCDLGRQIGAWKHSNNMPIYVPERERMLLERLTAENSGPLDRESLLAIYREIMSAAIKLERPITVAYMGPQGTFSHLAVLEKFGRGVIPQDVPTIDDVFRAVESGRADYGMVPVENTTEGVVNPTLDSLTSSNVKAVAEFNLPVHLFLYSASSVNEIRCIYSHAQPFGQCREYLQSNLRNATLIEVTSTTRAMELAERESDAAAIAGALAKEHSDLPCIAENIEDNCRNITRFLVIGNQENKPSGDDKTSLCFALHDRAGALYDALRPFRNHNISMTMIESRPLKSGNWEYCFFTDILGHQDDPEIAAACAELKQDCAMFKILGSYPKVL